MTGCPNLAADHGSSGQKVVLGYRAPCPADGTVGFRKVHFMGGRRRSVGTAGRHGPDQVNILLYPILLEAWDQKSLCHTPVTVCAPRGDTSVGPDTSSV